MEILKDILLAPFTTLKLGGKASYFVSCKSEEELKEALTFAKEKQLPYWILGGGSNTIVSDHGFPGIVIKIEIGGIEETQINDHEFLWKIGAGVNWDEFVLRSLTAGLVGVECLSGIPGLVGASPIQNIGAYGQDVSETIDSVRMIDLDLNLVEAKANDCHFKYRNSRFKSGDWKNHIITQVNFRLSKINSINVKYPEVAKIWTDSQEKSSYNQTRLDQLSDFRDLILGLRKSKSMLIDDQDPNSKSVGSFFTNPFLSEAQKIFFLSQVERKNLQPPQLFLEADGTFKVSAAWLIENSGFQKGMIQDGVGISSAHSLAIININGSTKALLNLAEEIRASVFNQFSINLSIEPVILR